MEVDAAALEALASDPEVVSIEEDKLLKPMLEESVSLIGAPRAWSQGFSGSGQTIAILDTGVDRDHPFLRGKVVSEACYSGSGRGESLCPGEFPRPLVWARVCPVRTLTCLVAIMVPSSRE